MLARRYALPEAVPARFEAMLVALEREPDPPTTVRRGIEAVEVHLADSLVALEFPRVRAARRIVDIGSGAGFPGLPLAIALPAARVDLLESARRKVDVIARLIAATAAHNARPVAERAEEWAAAAGRGAYEVAIARAVGPLPVLVEYAAPLLTGGGALLAWKGGRDAAEEEAGAAAASVLGLEQAEIVPVRPYGASRNRHIHVYLKVRETPARFPRRPGVAARRPVSR